MAVTNSIVFRESLEQVILPIIGDHGFCRWHPGRSYEGRVVNLRRITARRIDLVDIQFDKYGRLRCYVNFAQLDGKEIITMYEGVLPADQVTVAHLSERCRLIGNSLSGAFKAPLLVRLLDVAAAGKAVGDQIILRLPELEEWFSSQRSGRHVRCYRL